MAVASPPLMSFVVPVHNERASLVELHEQILRVCTEQAYSYEVVFVDDGSSDGSFSLVEELARQHANVRGIQFRRNYGQAAAMSAGIHASRAALIVTLDADLQNDPADVPRLLEKINEGYDVVSGWRKDRQDNWLRRFPSQLANSLISRVTGVRLSDYGCTLKVYRREYLDEVVLYGDMHRFIPVFAAWQGAKVTELPVNHRARQFGASHYGLKRTGRVIVDLLTVKFLNTYIARPMHFFGAIGALLIAIGGTAGLTAIYLRLTGIRHLVDTPLPLMAALLLIVGVQFLLMGLLAELLIRIYFERPGRHSYAIRRVIDALGSEVP